jgi:methyl-accepting chemotaxis protein
MKDWGVKFKFAIPVAVTLLTVVTVVSWLFISWQSEKAERMFSEELSSLAVTSSMMIHSEAEAYANAKSYQFHRVVIGTETSNDDRGKIDQEALRTFAANPKQKLFEQELKTDSASWLCVYAPARIEGACMTCHKAYRLELFPNSKEGDIVAAFGVSGSLQPLEEHKANIRFAAIALSLGVLALISFILHTTVRIVVERPLRELAASAVKIGRGDLSVTVPVRSHDEIGKVGIAFNEMVTNTKATINEVTEAMHAVASAVEQISSSSEQIASGTQEQSSQTAEIAAAMEQMSKSISVNSANATTLADTSRESKFTAHRGGEMVNQTIEAMRAIGMAVQNFATTTLSLGSSSNQIGEIVSVINDIADQTNLLALNAAIEAARAGEQGRGFAVVADEVRRLAERTVKATKEIETMIKQIQADSAEAVESLEQGTTAVDNGITNAEEAGIMLGGIVEITDSITDSILEIAKACQEQAASGSIITKNIDVISGVAQESASGAHEVSKATADLTQLSIRVQELLSKFRLETDDRRRDAGQYSTKVSRGPSLLKRALPKRSTIIEERESVEQL